MRIECFQNVLKVICLCWKKYHFHRSLPLVGDVNVLHDSPVTNGERETFSMIRFFQKPGHLNGCVEEPFHRR